MDSRLINRIHIHIQPIFNIKTNDIKYVEVLVRDTKDELNACQIVQYFKDRGECLYLDKLIVEKACMWMKLYKIINKKVCINICSDTMRVEGAARELVDIFKRFHIDTDDIVLEINEEVDFDRQDVKENVSVFFKSNVHLAIDDFGTHNTSLLVLGEVNVNTVKIDKKFLDNLTDRKILILSGLFELLKSINLDIIIEGVETMEQFNVVNSIGYSNIQGFLLAKPMDVFEYNKQYA